MDKELVMAVTERQGLRRQHELHLVVESHQLIDSEAEVLQESISEVFADILEYGRDRLASIGIPQAEEFYDIDSSDREGTLTRRNYHIS